MEEHLASSHIAQKAASGTIHVGFNPPLSPSATWLLTGSVNTRKGKGMKCHNYNGLKCAFHHSWKHWSSFNKLSRPSMFQAILKTAFYQDHSKKVQSSWARFPFFFVISWKNHQGHAIEITFKSLWWSLPCLVAVCIAPQYSDWNIRLRSNTWPWFRLPSILSGMQCSSYYYHIFLLWWYIREYEIRKCLASAEGSLT